MAMMNEMPGAMPKARKYTPRVKAGKYTPISKRTNIKLKAGPVLTPNILKGVREVAHQRELEKDAYKMPTQSSPPVNAFSYAKKKRTGM